MSRIYKSIYPTSQRSEYLENTNVSFRLSFEGQQIVQNSVRLCGNLSVSTIGGSSYDAPTGIHGAISQVSVEMAKRGMVESLQALPRWMKMQSETRQNDTEILSNSVNTTSLTLARDDQTTKFLDGVKELNVLPFACRLNCCLNNANGAIRWSRTGAITLNLRLASKDQFLTGTTAATAYKLTNLELMYQTVPEQKSNKPVQSSTYYMVKHTLNSANSSINTKIPQNVQSVSASFILADRENNKDYNNLECAVLPSVSRVQFTFNDSQNLVLQNMSSEQEILYNYLRSMGVRDFNNIRVNTLVNESKSYGIGLNFYRPVSERVGLEIVSGVQSNTPTSMYLYFRSVISF